MMTASPSGKRERHFVIIIKLATIIPKKQDWDQCQVIWINLLCKINEYWASNPKGPCSCLLCFML